jgi:hypothetical protein
MLTRLQDDDGAEWPPTNQDDDEESPQPKMVDIKGEILADHEAFIQYRTYLTLRDFCTHAPRLTIFST